MANRLGDVANAEVGALWRRRCSSAPLTLRLPNSPFLGSLSQASISHSCSWILAREATPRTWPGSRAGATAGSRTTTGIHDPERPDVARPSSKRLQLRWLLRCGLVLKACDVRGVVASLDVILEHLRLSLYEAERVRAGTYSTPILASAAAPHSVRLHVG